MKKQYILIIVGIVLLGFGVYMTNQALDSIPQNLRYQKELEKLATSTNYSIGIIFLALGIVIVGYTMFFWKRISSKK